MTQKDIIEKIDHTLLKQTATQEQIFALCKDALAFGTATVCIPPCHVKSVKDKFGDLLKICTVIGFPNGYSSTATKVFEATDAIAMGADEIDAVINIGWAQEEKYDLILKELLALRQATKGHVLKVIVETCFLSQEQKINLCKTVTEANADFIKTSTGFGTGGATQEDIILFKNHVGKQVKIKAAGGIKTLSDAESYVNLGCDRIGASSVLAQLKK